MIAVFMGKQDAVELFGRHAALLEAEDDLARAQPAIDENFAMIGRDERAVPGTAAAEHGETEHAPYLAAMFRFAQIKFARSTIKLRDQPERGCAASWHRNRASGIDESRRGGACR